MNVNGKEAGEGLMAEAVPETWAVAVKTSSCLWMGSWLAATSARAATALMKRVRAAFCCF